MVTKAWTRSRGSGSYDGMIWFLLGFAMLTTNTLISEFRVTTLSALSRRVVCDNVITLVICGHFEVAIGFYFKIKSTWLGMELWIRLL